MLISVTEEYDRTDTETTLKKKDNHNIMLHESPGNVEFEEINNMDIDIEDRMADESKIENELELIQ